MANKTFSKRFDFIYESLGAIPSVLGFSKFWGYKNDGKPKTWEKGQRPSGDDCRLLHEKLNLSLQWLIGEGEPEDPPQPATVPEETSVAELKARLALPNCGGAL